MASGYRLCLSVWCLSLVTLVSTGKTTYTNEWAVQILGNSQTADQIAARHGYINLGTVSTGAVDHDGSVRVAHWLLVFRFQGWMTFTVFKEGSSLAGWQDQPIITR